MTRPKSHSFAIHGLGRPATGYAPLEELTTSMKLERAAQDGRQASLLDEGDASSEAK